MRIALVTSFRADRKEPLANMLGRVRAAFLASGLGEPAIRFAFADAPIPGFPSSVDRALKRFPNWKRFLNAAADPGESMVRQLSNKGLSEAAGEPADYETLRAIAAGVPRSFPFHSVALQLHHAAFGVTPVGPAGGVTPGVVLSDSWWINGRSRGLMGVRLVEADAADPKLPEVPEAIAAIFAACGKVTGTTQLLLPEGAPPASAMQPAAANPQAARAVGEITASYKARLTEVIDRAALPHDLPPALEAMKVVSLGQKTGSKKPVLMRAFQGMGYDCKGESGMFTMRRRTGGNLTIEISLDVGTWSRSITGFYKVSGLGFSALLPLPVSKRALGVGQYSIGDADNWKRIVENLAALVKELDRDFVPQVEAASGKSPEWYRP